MRCSWQFLKNEDLCENITELQFVGKFKGTLLELLEILGCNLSASLK